MTNVFDKLGVRFDYPENWELDAEEVKQSEQTVTVYGPNGSFWSLQINPLDVDPQEMANEALQVMQGEYDNLDSLPVSETVAEYELIGYDMNFICLDLTNTARVRAFRDDVASYLILCQAEDRSDAAAREVFAAITESLLRSDS